MLAISCADFQNASIIEARIDWIIRFYCRRVILTEQKNAIGLLFPSKRGACTLSIPASFHISIFRCKRESADLILFSYFYKLRGANPNLRSHVYHTALYHWPAMGKCGPGLRDLSILGSDWSSGRSAERLVSFGCIVTGAHVTEPGVHLGVINSSLRISVLFASAIRNKLQ